MYCPIVSYLHIYYPTVFRLHYPIVFRLHMYWPIVSRPHTLVVPMLLCYLFGARSGVFSETDAVKQHVALPERMNNVSTWKGVTGITLKESSGPAPVPPPSPPPPGKKISTEFKHFDD